VLFSSTSRLISEGLQQVHSLSADPESVYSVSVSGFPALAAKVPGDNPWNQATANRTWLHCGKIGGGGHPRVSAIPSSPGSARGA